jgi:hypothetical protein
MRREWQEFREGDFLRLFPLNRTEVFAASERAIRLMALPIMMIWSLEAIWLIGWSWDGLGLVLYAGALGLWWSLAQLFAVPEV